MTIFFFETFLTGGVEEEEGAGLVAQGGFKLLSGNVSQYLILNHKLFYSVLIYADILWMQNVCFQVAGIFFKAKASSRTAQGPI